MKIFGWIYIVGLIAMGVIRWKYSRYYRSNRQVEQHFTPLLDRILLIVSCLGFVLPILHVFFNVFEQWEYHIPLWVQLIGILLMAVSIRLLRDAHADLGRFWSPFLEIMKKHDLVKSGVYHQVRHPIYAAFLLLAIAQCLLITNWIAGGSLLMFLLIFYTFRIRKEEVMFLQHFGKDYRDYIAQTGRFIPPNPFQFLQKIKKNTK